MKNVNFVSVSSVLASVILLTSPAIGQEQSGWESDGFLRWNNETTGDEFKLRGRLLLDAANLDWTEGGVETEIQDSEIRDARLGFQGRSGSFKYVAEFGFLNETISAKALYVTYAADGFNVQVGHMKTPNSIEFLSAPLYSTFMERGSGSYLYSLGRQVGVAVSTSGDNYSFKAGVYGGRFGDLSESVELDDSSAVAARLTYVPINTDDMLVHLGASFRHYDYGGAGTRVRSRAGAHLTPRLVTADFRPGRPLGEADTSMLWEVEAAIVSGPFYVHGEYMTMNVDGPTDDPTFDSVFVNTGWFLTGETRPYRTSSGTFTRISPNSPVSEGGHGAWEVAARYDHSDLNEVAAGELTTWSLGLNWYVDKRFRIMANIVDGERSLTGGNDISADGAQIRMQWDF